MSDNPVAVERLRDAVNRGDTEAFLALFPPDGVVEDWGRRFVGHAAIRGWSDRELIGAHGTLTVTRLVNATPSLVVIETHWTSSAFTGDSVFRLSLEGDLIGELRISED